MKVTLWIVVSAIAVIGTVALVGFFLPVKHEAARSAEFSRRPEAIWTLIADPNTYHQWWAGADVKTKIVESVPPLRLVTKIVEQTQFGGTWTIEIVPTPSGSRLTITERGEIYNIIFRALARYVFGYTSTMDSFLAALSAKLN